MEKWLYFFRNSSLKHFLEIILFYLVIKSDKKVSRISRVEIELLEFSYQEKLRFELKNGFFNIEIRINRHFRTCKLRWNTSDVLVFRQIILKEELKPVVEYFDKTGKKPTAIVDAGANIGLTSLYFSSFFPNAKVICVEPNEENSKMLEINLFPFNYQFLKKGLWHKQTYLNETLSDSAWGIQVVEVNKEHVGKIESITLSEIFDNYNLRRIDYLKMDIEGAEEKIFYEDPLIDNVLDRVTCISIEAHSKEFEKFVFNHLVNRKFKVYKVNSLVFGFKHG